MHVRTERLELRPWREADRGPWAEVNADPAVMEYFPATMSRAESDAWLDRVIADAAERGWGWRALAELGSGDLVGGVAIVPVGFESWFTPAVEIGWRLARRHWGRGYATEAAAALIHHGFTRLGLDEIVAFTAEGNRRSEAVMQRVGMKPDPERPTFDHPRLPDGHPLRRHLLYRTSAPSADPPDQQ